MAIHNASWLRFSDAAALGDNIQVNPVHLNASNGSGVGVQYILEQAILAHNHVDHSLLVAKFPEFLNQPYFGWYKDGNIYDGITYSYRDPVDTSSDNEIPWFDSNVAVFEAFAALTLNWISQGSYHIGTPLIETVPSLLIKHFQWNSSTYNNFTYLGSLPTDGPGMYGSAYGFNRFSLFANGIKPSSLDVSIIDVNSGRNSTFADHISDLSIHRVQLPPVVLVSQNDHMAFWGGALNLYGTKSYELEYTASPMFRTDVDNTPPVRHISDPANSRADDDYPFNKFLDQDEYYDLDRVGVHLDDSVDGLENNTLHPLLYEEAVYMWNGQKIKQYKLVKADPDDIALAEVRKTSGFLGIFRGGTGLESHNSVAFDEGTEKFMIVVNSAADTYFYNNFYFDGKNSEYNPFDESRIVAMLQTDGLGFQSARGVSSGC
jgi:hypothetical protein